MNTVDTHHLPPEDILVVEDNRSSLKLLSDILTQAGHRVRAAGDGELALRSAQAKPPALILLDVRMPGLSGLEVCRRLKADPGTRDLPVLFISALDETSLKVQAFEAGAVDYVTKPFEPAEVLARIDTHLNIHRLQRELETQTEKLSEEIEERQRAEEALAASEVRYRRLFETAKDGILLLDAETGVVTDANPFVVDLLGFSPEAILG